MKAAIRAAMCVSTVDRISGSTGRYSRIESVYGGPAAMMDLPGSFGVHTSTT